MGLPGEALGPQRGPLEKKTTKKEFRALHLELHFEQFSGKNVENAVSGPSFSGTRLLSPFLYRFWALLCVFGMFLGGCWRLFLVSFRCDSQNKKTCFDCAGVVNLHVPPSTGTTVFMFFSCFWMLFSQCRFGWTFDRFWRVFWKGFGALLLPLCTDVAVRADFLRCQISGHKK